MEKVDKNTQVELAALMKRLLLEEIDKAMILCLKGGYNPLYPAQTGSGFDKVYPLSYHLGWLKEALEKGDLAVVGKYRRGIGSWFPYNNLVEDYLVEEEAVTA